MNKPISLPVWFAALLAAPVSALCLLPTAATAQPLLGVEAALSQVSVSADYMSQNYHESGSLDREIGTLPGAVVDIGYLAPPITGLTDLYLGGEFQYSSGNLKYHGATLIGDIPVNDNTNTRIENGFIEFGKGFYVGSPDFMLVPVVYWGQRNWDRDLEGDYEDEQYRTSRVGVAVHAAWGLSSRITAFGRLGVADTLNPDMQLYSEGGTLKFYQRSEPEVEAELGLDVLVAYNWHVRAAVDVNQFSYGQSGDDDGYLEPTSSTTDISVKAGVGYSFP